MALCTSTGSPAAVVSCGPELTIPLKLMDQVFSLSESVPSWTEQELKQLSLSPSNNCLHPSREWRTVRPDIETGESLSGTVLIDMDNTLNDWDAQFRRLMAKYNPSIKLVDAAQRQHYSIEKNYSLEHASDICRLTSLRGFWSTMPMATGAKAALQEMVEMGLDVKVVSTPDDHYTGRCAMEKYEWLENNLGAEWKSRLILAQDKTLVRGTCLIDDKPTAPRGMFEPEWNFVIFCQPYNVGVQTEGNTLHAWDDWFNTLAAHLVVTKRGKN